MKLRLLSIGLVGIALLASCSPSRTSSVTIAKSGEASVEVKLAIPNWKGAVGVQWIGNGQYPSLAQTKYEETEKASLALISASHFEYVSLGLLDIPYKPVTEYDSSVPSRAMLFKWSDSESLGLYCVMDSMLDKDYPIKTSKNAARYWFFLTGTKSVIETPFPDSQHALIGATDNESAFATWKKAYDDASKDIVKGGD